MRKKEFKLLLATNPKLREWLQENESRLKARPEVLFYLTRHPDGMKHFRSDKPVNNQEIVRESQLFMQKIARERLEKRNKKRKSLLTPRAPRRLPLLENFKTLFGNKRMDASVNPASSPARGLKNKIAPLPVSVGATRKKRTKSAIQPFSSLKFKKLSRKKVMDTLRQTTEMLDVIGALIGKASHFK